MSEKMCSGCKQMVDCSRFSPHKKAADRLSSQCRSCASAANRRYRKSAAGQAARRRYDVKNRIKERARVMLYTAVKRGEVVRQPCEKCGNPESHAHHDDYGKPLDVRWLCPKHHVEWHMHNKPKVPDFDTFKVLSKSGYRCVTLDRGMFIARVRRNYLGCFRTAEAAAAAVEAFQKKESE